MELAMQVVNMGRNIRTEHRLKVRQPLQALHVATHRDEVASHMGDMLDIIKEELNVKEVHFLHNQEELAHAQTKANFRTLGKRCGKQMKAVAARVGALTPDEVTATLNGETVSVDVDGTAFDLTPEDVLIEYQPKEGLAVAAEGELVVALDTTLTPALEEEGLARELVNNIQQLRKTEGLDVSDRIVLSVTGSDRIQKAVAAYTDWIMQEVLAVEVNGGVSDDAEPIELNGESCTISLARS